MRSPGVSPEQAQVLSQTSLDETFITGNGIAARCRHVLNYGALEENESGRDGWWFCKADYLEYLRAHHRPVAPYVLFTHNSDRAIDDRFRPWLDDPLLVAWFAQNPAVGHPKLRALPIGIANPHWSHGDQAALKRVQEEAPTKDDLFDVSFNPGTNPAEREYCLLETGLELAERLPYEEYLRRLAGSFFCVSPRGNGIDCVRTWEALYVGTIPIVSRSLITDEFADFPIIVLDDWSEFSGIEFSPELYWSVWRDWSPEVIRLDRYFERVERTIASLSP